LARSPITFARTRFAAVAFFLSIFFLVSKTNAQEFTIGIIDVYGLRRVSFDQVEAALTFKEGDRIAMAADGPPRVLTDSESRLSRLPGVTRARIDPVCCDQGRAIIFVGIEEQGALTLSLRAAPTGNARLADDIVQSGKEFFEALMTAIQRGDSGEDHSQGHALNDDPATRAVQERFVRYAKRDLRQLRLVLRTSSDRGQRALAAQVLGYAADKKAVVTDLVRAMSDPSDEVRNSAMRTLLVFADARSEGSASIPRIPVEPFIEFLNSPVWSDRNKSSGALLALSAKRDPRLLAAVRKKALASLVEMARFKSVGHAYAAFIILARIVGYSDAVAESLLDRGEREVVIKAAIAQR
jgi:HEAT repeat protein